MKRATVILLILAATFSRAQTCRFGLGYAYGNDSCASREAVALQRVAAARSICMSGNTSVQWNKNSKEPSWAWADLEAGELEAVKDFTLQTCEHADLVVKYVYDDMSENVTINVTDADSGATVFEESRSVSDLRSDAVRMASHWHDMVIDAKAAKAAAEEAEREKEKQARLEYEAGQCELRFNALKNSIIDYIEVQHVPLPQTVLNQIAAHNQSCPNNTISLEVVEQQEKADAAAKLAEEEAAKEKAAREQFAAYMEKERANALTAWKNRVALAPFVPPVEGWINAAELPNGSFYIILPGTGLTSNCHLTTDYSKPELDCLGVPGRDDYFSVQSNNRWYLLKSGWTGAGQYAGTVKENGTKLCLRKAGCYRVLAEVRVDPDELPDKFQVPTPGPLTLKYSNGDFSFTYPQNWQTQEMRGKDNSLSSVNAAPPEGHLASWITHGFIVGHVAKMPSDFPRTLDGAFNQFSAIQRLRGLAVVDSQKVIPIGSSQGRFATYTSTSVLSAGESGWILVVKDKGEGYYWLLMFYPGNDDGNLYAQTFNDILKSFTFEQ